MWILKGTFLGLWLWGFGTIAFFYFSLFRNIPFFHSSVGLRIITGATTQNVWWWVALASCLGLGLGLVRSWPGNGSVAFWVALLVTSVVPFGLFGLYGYLAVRLHQIVGHLNN